MCSPVVASQIFTVASADADAIKRPFGDIRTCETGLEWPRRTRWVLESIGAWREDDCDRERDREERGDLVRDVIRDGERERSRESDRLLDMDCDLNRDLDRDVRRLS
ncbi:hypothetical protein HG531_002410 [Fusarium graminearum]|nr:hypothetical protein HG531_002410 [Fusarium graminearum]